MHQVLSALESELRQVATAVQSTTGEDRAVSIIHNNALSAGVDRHELSLIATNLADRIAAEGGDEIKANEQLLSQYPHRLQFLRGNTVTNLFNGNGNQAVPAYLLTLQALEQALKPSLAIDPAKVSDDVKTAKALQTKLRGLGSRIEGLEPKVDTLQAMASQIVEAHAAADQLPTDLATLREAREEIQSLRDQAAKDRDAANKLLEQMRQSEAKLKSDISEAEQALNKRKQEWDALMQTSTESATGIINRCEDAMRSSTSLGLAGAFQEKAKSLNWSMLFWVLGLIAALVGGAYLVHDPLQQFSLALQSSSPSSVIIWARLSILLLSAGGPIWFAWIATKQIGQLFRLSEDYAYKASISRAYEGYRREAIQLDGDFQVKLLASALQRLDEQPLRFVEHKTHGSPWHEMLDSDVVKEAIKIVPGFAESIAGMAKTKIEEVKQSIKPKANSQAEPATANQDENQ